MYEKKNRGAAERRGLAEGNRDRSADSRPKSSLRLAWRALTSLALAMGLISCSPQATMPPIETPPWPFRPGGELPPLPPPSAEQLQRGRELIDKIAYVVDNVPLTDAAAVLKVFGFEDLHTEGKTPDVGPRGKAGRHTLPEELLGTGISWIRVQPQLTNPDGEPRASFFADFRQGEACVAFEDVKQRFGPMAKAIRSPPLIDIHPVARPPALHSFAHLDFSLKDSSLGTRRGVHFRFEYQTCAVGFSYGYRRKID